MKTDLFISYAWTSDSHREWVRLLASHLDLIGYTVKIDEAVRYGSSLSGFMREVIETDHVLLLSMIIMSNALITIRILELVLKTNG